MRKLEELLKEYKEQDTGKTERGELLQEFLDNVNQERDKKLRSITFSRMGFLLEGLSNQDLYKFMSMCKDRKQRNGSFSKFFWWALKS
jgi:hypothetical protein